MVATELQPYLVYLRILNSYLDCRRGQRQGEHHASARRLASVVTLIQTHVAFSTLSLYIDHSKLPWFLQWTGGTNIRA